MQIWIFYAFGALSLIVAFNLCFQWAVNLKISSEKLLLYFFFGGFIGFFLLDIPHLPNLFLSGRLGLLMFWGIVVALLSVAANYLTVASYKTAPNPGYVEGIKSSNGIFSTLIGLILFGSPVFWLKWVGIIIIPIGLYFFLVEKNGNQVKSNHWRLLAILSAIAVAIMFIVWGYMSTTLGFSPMEILMALFFFATIIFLIIALFKPSPWLYPVKSFWPVILAIIFAIPANLMNIMAIEKYGSAGVPTTIYNIQAALTLIVAGFVFPEGKGGELIMKKAIMVGVILFGAILIILSP